MSVIEKIAERLSNSFIGYLHLCSWLDGCVRSALWSTRVRRFNSVADFWAALFAEELHHGDRVQFTDAFVTEWVPREPGAIWFSAQKFPQAWNSDAAHSLDALRHGTCSYSGEAVLDRLPYGVVRLPFGTDEFAYAALGLTTPDAWCCDLGIPLVVSASVYNAFAARRIRTKAVAATLEGTLEFGQHPLLDPELLRCLGSDINVSYLETLVRPRGFPAIYLRCVSPLNCSFLSNDSHPIGALWTVVQKNRVATFELNGERLEACEPFADYSFLCSFAEIDCPDWVRVCATLFDKGLSHTFDTTGMLGVSSCEVLTEFDARTRHFPTSIPLEIRPWNDDAAKARIGRITGDLCRLGIRQYPALERCHLDAFCKRKNGVLTVLVPQESSWVPPADSP